MKTLAFIILFLSSLSLYEQRCTQWPADYPEKVFTEATFFSGKLLPVNAITHVSEAPAFSGRMVVPIYQKVFGNHTLRYSIPITIGHTKLEAMLDTGSPGIQLLPGATQFGDFTATTQKTNIHYGSGIKLDGVVANALISIGNFHSNTRVPISAVQIIGCDSAHHHCPVSQMPQQDYRIGGTGNPREGFQAIIGINLAAHAKVNNPLPEMGIHTWIIILPKPGDKKPGELILNPEQADLAGYTLFHLNLASTPKDGITSCITNLRTNKKVCGPTMLDTGKPGITVISAREGNNHPSRFRVGDPVTINFTNQNGESLTPELFTDNADGAGHIRVSPPKKHQIDNSVYAGILPFFDYSVLYESNQNIIGLKTRNPGLKNRTAAIK